MGMELLIGAIISLALELFKKLADRFGREVTLQAIYIGLFGTVVVWTVLIREQIITIATLQYATTILSASVASYELVIKRVKRYLEQRQA